MDAKGVVNKRPASKTPAPVKAEEPDETGVVWALRSDKAMVWMVHDFLSPDEAAYLFDELIHPKAEVPLLPRQIVIYGKEITQPRLVGFAAETEGLEYRYSGASIRACLWPDWLKKLCADVNRTAGTNFNSVLINYYRDGDDYIAAHSDDERMLGDNNAVAAIALGPGASQRPLLFRPKSRRSAPPVAVAMPAGSLLVMAGKTQTHYTHEIPKNARLEDPRISLTFREIHEK